jgi:hypothetical protein
MAAATKGCICGKGLEINILFLIVSINYRPRPIAEILRKVKDRVFAEVQGREVPGLSLTSAL